MKKICLISSSGGHFEQLSRLKGLANSNEIVVVTEKTHYKASHDEIYYVPQVNREEKLAFMRLLWIAVISTFIFFRERPDVVISTGALCSVPMLELARIFGKKVIFIESFAKVSSPTKTGQLVYKFADLFIVQWPAMKEFYPNAVCLGSIY